MSVQLTLLELPIAPSTAEWRISERIGDRAMAWVSATFPGITIRRNPKHTCHRPYYIDIGDGVPPIIAYHHFMEARGAALRAWAARRTTR